MHTSQTGFEKKLLFLDQMMRQAGCVHVCDMMESYIHNGWGHHAYRSGNKLCWSSTNVQKMVKNTKLPGFRLSMVKRLNAMGLLFY